MRRDLINEFIVEDSLFYWYNNSINIVYTEFINYSWTEYDFQNPNFYEMYDLNNDSYQIYNIYDTLTQSEKNYYHNMLIKLGSCKGESCP